MSESLLWPDFNQFYTCFTWSPSCYVAMPGKALERRHVTIFESLILISIKVNNYNSDSKERWHINNTRISNKE